MSGPEQRTAVRVACDLPLRLLTDLQVVSATVLDISRTGIRVRLPGRRLGVRPDSTLVQVAQRVSGVLGHAFVVELHRDQGDVVRKTLEPVRIGQRMGDSADVEIGCRITEPLSSGECASLGLDLPGHDVHPGHLVTRTNGSTNGKGRRPARRPDTDGIGDTNRGYAAFVHPDAAKRRPPFATSTESIDEEAALLRVSDVSRLDLLREVKDVSTFVVALDAAYGSRVAVEIRRGGKHVWTGPARIQSVELIDSQPVQAILGVGFNKKLGPAPILRNRTRV